MTLFNSFREQQAKYVPVGLYFGTLPDNSFSIDTKLYSIETNGFVKLGSSVVSLGQVGDALFVGANSIVYHEIISYAKKILKPMRRTEKEIQIGFEWHLSKGTIVELDNLITSFLDTHTLQPTSIYHSSLATRSEDFQGIEVTSAVLWNSEIVSLRDSLSYILWSLAGCFNNLYELFNVVSQKYPQLDTSNTSLTQAIEMLVKSGCAYIDAY